MTKAATTSAITTAIPQDVDALLTMLTYRRPEGSKSERKFINRFIRPLGVEADDFGNLYKRIGRAPVVWSCHTDTVHKSGGTQAIAVKDCFVQLAKAEIISNCLGADDTAGVWLMCEMIRAGVEGLYIFHRSEESGGHGSAYIAARTPNLVSTFKTVIALDRRDTDNVITHQAMGRCCSDAFAESLAAALGLGYEPCANGIFTDSANYTHLVGECTNLSVGYYNEHTRRECLDLTHIARLRDQLIRIDTSKLAYVRQPGEEDNLWEDYGAPYGTLLDQELPNYGEGHAGMVALIEDNPCAIAEMLAEYGYDYRALSAELAKLGAFVPR